MCKRHRSVVVPNFNSLRSAFILASRENFLIQLKICRVVLILVTRTQLVIRRPAMFEPYITDATHWAANPLQRCTNHYQVKVEGASRICYTCMSGPMSCLSKGDCWVARKGQADLSMDCIDGVGTGIFYDSRTAPSLLKVLWHAKGPQADLWAERGRKITRCYSRV